jgi:hypothetical protein
MVAPCSKIKFKNESSCDIFAFIWIHSHFFLLMQSVCLVFVLVAPTIASSSPHLEHGPTKT